MAPKRCTCFLAAALIWAAFSTEVALAKEVKPVLISRASGANGANADGKSGFPAVSADGRYVAFESSATNLDPADTSRDSDIYVRDLERDTTMLVSRASGVDGAKGDGNSTEPAISADGRYVAFTSSALNLGPVLAQSGPQVFVRDLASHTTTLVSRGPDGAPADHISNDPSISGDGRFVAFASVAQNFNDDGRPVLSEVYLRDLATETTTLISRQSGADGARGGGFSYGPAISADGSRVAFASDGALGVVVGTRPFLYLRDLATSTTTLESRAQGVGGKVVAIEFPPTTISAHGTRLPFTAKRSALGTGPRLSGFDVFLRTTGSARTSLVSGGIAAGETRGAHHTVNPSISSNGRYVAFGLGPPEEGEGESKLVRTDGLYVRDLKKKKSTQLLNFPRSGTPRDLYSVLSQNGDLLAFQANGKRIHPSDRDRRMGVYAVSLRD